MQPKEALQQLHTYFTHLREEELFDEDLNGASGRAFPRKDTLCLRTMLRDIASTLRTHLGDNSKHGAFGYRDVFITSESFFLCQHNFPVNHAHEIPSLKPDQIRVSLTQTAIGVPILRIHQGTFLQERIQFQDLPVNNLPGLRKYDTLTITHLTFKSDVVEPGKTLTGLRFLPYRKDNVYDWKTHGKDRINRVIRLLELAMEA